MNTEVFENRFALRAFTRATVPPLERQKIREEKRGKEKGRERERDAHMHLHANATTRCILARVASSSALFHSAERSPPNLDRAERRFRWWPTRGKNRAGITRGKISVARFDSDEILMWH